MTELWFIWTEKVIVRMCCLLIVCKLNITSYTKNKNKINIQITENKSKIDKIIK